MKFRIIMACTLALVILAAPVMAADGVIFLTLDISDQDEITDYDLFFLDEQEGYDFTRQAGTMTVQILTEDEDVLYVTGFTPIFLLLTNPPVRIEHTTVILTLPCDSRASKVRIYDNTSEEIFSIPLHESMCNRKGACDSFENVYSCPDDCSIFSNDGVCASVSRDGGCDPDCPSWRDLDCSCPNGVCEYWENSEYCAADCSEGFWNWGYMIYLIPLSLLAGAASFLVARRLQAGKHDEAYQLGNGL